MITTSARRPPSLGCFSRNDSEMNGAMKPKLPAGGKTCAIMMCIEKKEGERQNLRVTQCGFSIYHYTWVFNLCIWSKSLNSSDFMLLWTQDFLCFRLPNKMLMTLRNNSENAKKAKFWVKEENGNEKQKSVQNPKMRGQKYTHLTLIKSYFCANGK